MCLLILKSLLEGIRPPRAEILGNKEPPDVGAEN